MERESLLYAATIRHASYRKGLRDTTAVLRNHGTLENLDSFPRTLFDPVVDLHGAADLNDRGILLNLLTYKSLNLIHLRLLLIQRTFVQSIAEDCSESCAYAQRVDYTMQNSLLQAFF